MSSIPFNWQNRSTRCWLTTGVSSWSHDSLTPIPQSVNSCLKNGGMMIILVPLFSMYGSVILTIIVIMFLCPQRNFGRHIVIALSVRPSVRQSVSPSVRPSVRPSRFRVRSISPIFFEVGISNLVCGYILGWRSVAYHFRVTATLTLTSDLVFRIIVSGIYLWYSLR